MTPAARVIAGSAATKPTTFTATEGELKERVAVLADAGYDEIALLTVPSQEHAIEGRGRIRRAFP